MSFIDGKKSIAKAHYIENTQLHKDNQPEEMHTNICYEESEVNLFFSQSLTNDDAKKNKTQRIWTYLKHLLIFISKQKNEEKTLEFLVESNKIDKKIKSWKTHMPCFKSK